MTDKQIIIDGVDVSGCKYSSFDDGCSMLKTCKNNPNCYYKQLQRKEQKLNKIENVCNDILENYIKHSLACVELAEKILDECE